MIYNDLYRDYSSRYRHFLFPYFFKNNCISLHISAIAFRSLSVFGWNLFHLVVHHICRFRVLSSRVLFWFSVFLLRYSSIYKYDLNNRGRIEYFHYYYFGKIRNYWYKTNQVHERAISCDLRPNFLPFSGRVIWLYWVYAALCCTSWVYIW